MERRHVPKLTPAGAGKFQGQTPTLLCNRCRLEDYFFLPEGALKDRHLGFFSGVNKITHINDKREQSAI